MAIKKQLIERMNESGRTTSIADFDAPELGPLRMFPGIWENTEELKGFGFNMMALPFQQGTNGYRILMNQYKEELNFSVVDKGVPNRGRTIDPETGSHDQTIVALNYFQLITQIDSGDFPGTDLNERFHGKPIHKEPGLWLHMTDHETSNINVARLGTIPHGNSFVAVGRVPNNRADEDSEDNFYFLENPTESELEQLLHPQNPRLIPNINGVVVGGGEDPKEIDLEPIVDVVTGDQLIDYFEPYRHFHQSPYKGSEAIPGYDGFDPVHTTQLLRHALKEVIMPIGKIKRVMRLSVDSTIDHAGINRFAHSGIINIPFVVREADAASMNSTFIIYEVQDKETGEIRHFMQYAQNVILDFIGRPDGHPGRARWPHVSINTMERVSNASSEGVTKGLL